MSKRKTIILLILYFIIIISLFTAGKTAGKYDDALWFSGVVGFVCVMKLLEPKNKS